MLIYVVYIYRCDSLILWPAGSTLTNYLYIFSSMFTLYAHIVYIYLYIFREQHVRLHHCHDPPRRERVEQGQFRYPYRQPRRAADFASAVVRNHLFRTRLRVPDLVSTHVTLIKIKLIINIKEEESKSRIHRPKVET